MPTCTQTLVHFKTVHTYPLAFVFTQQTNHFYTKSNPFGQRHFIYRDGALSSKWKRQFRLIYRDTRASEKFVWIHARTLIKAKVSDCLHWPGIFSLTVTSSFMLESFAAFPASSLSLYPGCLLLLGYKREKGYKSEILRSQLYYLRRCACCNVLCPDWMADWISYCWSSQIIAVILPLHCNPWLHCLLEESSLEGLNLYLKLLNWLIFVSRNLKFKYCLTKIWIRPSTIIF